MYESLNNVRFLFDTINSMIISTEYLQDQSFVFPFCTSVKAELSSADNSINSFNCWRSSNISIKFKWMILEYLIQEKLSRGLKAGLQSIISQSGTKKERPLKRLHSFGLNQEQNKNCEEQSMEATIKRADIFQILSVEIETMKKKKRNQRRSQFYKQSHLSSTAPSNFYSSSHHRISKNSSSSKNSSEIRPSICFLIKNEDENDEDQSNKQNEAKKKPIFPSTSNIYESLISIIQNKSGKRKKSDIEDDEEFKQRISRKSLTSAFQAKSQLQSRRDVFIAKNMVSVSKIALLTIFSTIKSKFMVLKLMAFSVLRFHNDNLLPTTQDQQNYIKRSIDLLQENLQKDEQIMELHQQLQLKRNQIEAMEQQINLLKNSIKFNIFYKLQQLWKSSIIIGFNMIVSRDLDNSRSKSIEHSTKFDEISEIIIRAPTDLEFKPRIKTKTLIYLDAPDPTKKIIGTDQSIDYEGMCSVHNLVERDGYQPQSTVLSNSSHEND